MLNYNIFLLLQEGHRVIMTQLSKLMMVHFLIQLILNKEFFIYHNKIHKNHRIKSTFHLPIKSIKHIFMKTNVQILNIEDYCISLSHFNIFFFNQDLIMKNNNKKCVDCSLIQSKNIQEEMICSICLQFMTNPYKINCGAIKGHIFGINCIKQWMASNKKKQCPLCRGTFDQLYIAQQLKEKSHSYKAACPGCSQVFDIASITTHSNSCQILRKSLLTKLNQIVSKQKQYLEMQINPHLREIHGKIYDQHVKDWNWLDRDVRDWKWWWWCNQPWWKNQACQRCNELWHKYEKQIDQIQIKRIQILNDLN